MALEKKSPRPRSFFVALIFSRSWRNGARIGPRLNKQAAISRLLF
jgi:hypothetical protein